MLENAIVYKIMYKIGFAVGICSGNTGRTRILEITPIRGRDPWKEGP